MWFGPANGDRIATAGSARRNGYALDGRHVGGAAQIDVQQAVFQQMWADVATRQSLTPQDLQELAEQRAQAIKQFLVENASFDHERIDLPAIAASGLTGRICTLALEPQ